MDMMEMRFRMMAMLGGADMGAEVIKGTFTVPDDSQGTYTINIGKTLSKYMFIVEMVDSSKTALLATANTSTKMYCSEGMYPQPAINNVSNVSNIMSYRVKPSTGEVSYAATSVQTVNGQQITFTTGAITAGTNLLYKGYSYNYTIVSLDNV